MRGVRGDLGTVLTKLVLCISLLIAAWNLWNSASRLAALPGLLSSLPVSRESCWQVERKGETNILLQDILHFFLHGLNYHVIPVPYYIESSKI